MYSSEYLKGTIAQDFLVSFFHKTIPPGPIRQSLKPFLKKNFHGVLEVLKHFPGRTLGNRELPVSGTPGICKLPGPG